MMKKGQIKVSHKYDYECLKGYFLQDGELGDGEEDGEGSDGIGDGFDYVSVTFHT